MFEIIDKSELTKGEVTYLVIKFLRRKCLLEEFCEEYSDYHKRHHQCDLKTTIRVAVKNCWEIASFFENLESSFLWKKTRRGYCFWYKLSKEWKEYTIGKRFIYGL